MIVRSTNVTNTAALASWCREYHFNNPWPADFSKRFAIGWYQVYGGIEWAGQPQNVAEAFCAAALHFLMVIESLELDWSPHLPPDVCDFGYAAYRNFETLTVHSSRAQQHILYASQAMGLKGTIKTGRTSRYNPGLLSNDLCHLVMLMFTWVPPDRRSEGIEDASRNMTVKI